MHMPAKNLIILLSNPPAKTPLATVKDVVVACVTPEEYGEWQARHPEICPRDLCRDIRAEIPAATERISEFFAHCRTWPIFPSIQGSDIPSPDHLNRSCFWLFNYISEKNYPLLKINSALAALTVLRKICEEAKPKHIVILGGEPRERDFLGRNLGPKPYRSRLRFIGEYLSVTARFAFAIVRQARTWRFLWHHLPPPPGRARGTALLSAIPLIWKKNGDAWGDRYYHRLREHLPDSRFLFSIRDESLSIPPGKMRERWDFIQQIGQSFSLAGHDFLEAFIRPADFLAAYWRGCRIFFRFLLHRHRIVRQFRDDGVQLYPMLREKFETSVIQFPEVLLNYVAARRFACATGCTKLVMHGFEFRWNRAISLGLHHEGGHVIGIQHGPFTTMKGLYSYFEEELDQEYLDMLPDAILVDGEISKSVLCRHNHRLADRIHVLGAPRFDGLANKLREIRLPPTRLDDRKGITLLVTPGHTDTPQVIAALRRFIIAAKPHLREVIFKTHPLVGEAGEQAFLATFAELENRLIRSVSRDDVHLLMLRADALACTYSSCAVEALALGLPVMCLEIGSSANFSQLPDLPDYRDFIDSPETFRDFLSALPEKRAAAQFMRDRIEQGFFHRLDGRSAERMALFIMNHA